MNLFRQYVNSLPVHGQAVVTEYCVGCYKPINTHIENVNAMNSWAFKSESPAVRFDGRRFSYSLHQPNGWCKECGSHGEKVKPAQKMKDEELVFEDGDLDLDF